MTTTPEVPMPERPKLSDGIIRDTITPPGRWTIQEEAAIRAYADARCAALQAERDALAEKVKAIDQRSATTQALIAMLIERDKRGLAKYGQTLDRTDLTHAEWLQHMAEEMLDGAGYALAAIRANAAIDAAGDQP